MVEKIKEEMGFTPSEKRLVQRSSSRDRRIINQTRVLSELYLAKQISACAEKVIKSNERLGESVEKYTGVMVWLTRALVFVGLCHIIAAIIS